VLVNEEDALNQVSGEYDLCNATSF